MYPAETGESLQGSAYESTLRREFGVRCCPWLFLTFYYRQLEACGGTIDQYTIEKSLWSVMCRLFFLFFFFCHFLAVFLYSSMDLYVQKLL